ncbi:MAG TPA: GAF domain-containing sensor histidine kinase [Candidatus Acidoferrum sp.]|nr:GAF domain-containing sensor histidine kinase [Candidatus Acidoferrum sp.]
MPLDNTERLYLDRQITLARVILVSLALVTSLESMTQREHNAPALYLAVYLATSMALVLAGRRWGPFQLRIPLPADFLAVAVFFFLRPEVTAAWFLLLFLAFAIGAGGNTRAMVAFVAAATAGVMFKDAISSGRGHGTVPHLLEVGLGTLISGLGAGYLGAREREHLVRQQFLDKLVRLLQFDRGLTECIRQMLGELALEFECESACLAIRDDDMERLFVWRVRPGETGPSAPETLSLVKSEIFLCDEFETSLCWDFEDKQGFGWDRRTETAARVNNPPSLMQKELGARAILGVSIEANGRPSGRVLLVNPRRRFQPKDLRWLDQIVRQAGPPLDNVFLMRHLRARAVEAERSRISRDLHDGILQTLLSLIIQLGVLSQKSAALSGPISEDLTRLQRTVQRESEELRKFVTDLRPLRVASADLRELMLGFAERFRNDSGMALDLFIEDRSLRIPDRICREVFQIYREALNNVKKHANAGHVVVKLGQDEAKVSLVVDDNGRGFSFSGRYTSEELDRLRLGPISIKERTRGVGGTLTLESNPGHGARLTIEIPLS